MVPSKSWDQQFLCLENDFRSRPDLSAVKRESSRFGQLVSSLVGMRWSPQHAEDYIKRDGTRLQREHGNLDHRPDNIFWGCIPFFPAKNQKVLSALSSRSYPGVVHVRARRILFMNTTIHRGSHGGNTCFIAAVVDPETLSLKCVNFKP